MKPERQQESNYEKLFKANKLQFFENKMGGKGVTGRLPYFSQYKISKVVDRKKEKST